MRFKSDIDAILEFWFEETGPKGWYAKNPDFDAMVAERFGDLATRAQNGELDLWAQHAEGALALLLLLDQFPRNMHRDSRTAFATDPKARDIADNAIAKDFDLAHLPKRRQFFYLPFMHSENLADQERCIALIEARGEVDTLKWALKHRDIIARFGRFPHRNQALGRQSTLEEIAFLDHPGGGF